MPSDPRTQLVLAALRRHPELDANAVLSVFRQEGLSGGIGDGGHAFGPAQLNDAGGVITGKFPAWSPQQKQAWAWSPPGIDYALQGVSRVAGGRRGPDAVRHIVSDFERPQDPGGEIARALGQGSQVGGGASGSLSAGLTAAAAPDSRRQFAQQLLGAISPTGQLDSPGALVQALQTRRTSSAGPAPSPVAAASAPASGGSVDALLHQFGLADAVTSGYRSAADNKRVGGSPTSLHLTNRARDVNPNDPGFPGFVSYVQSHPQSVSEFFYDPLGWYVKGGRVVKGAIGGHSDHAHIGR
jgi:hypothetical protein